MSKLLGALLLGIGVLGGCGSGDDGDSPDPAANAGNGGALGSAGTQGNGGSGGATTSEDFAILSSCRAEVCESAGVHLIEGTMVQPSGDVGCILRALRDRKPGRYAYGTMATWANGNLDADHVLVVGDDGSVSYARQYQASVSQSSQGPVMKSGSDPARRCTLKPASYLDTCLAALSALDGSSLVSSAPSCLYGEGGTGTSPAELSWFESCSSATPATCP